MAENNLNAAIEYNVQTRPNTSEYLKSKVLLVMHEQDRSRYQKMITDEILSISDCAVYSLKEEDERSLNSGVKSSERHIEDIREMRVVIAVITRRFLTEPSFAKDRQVTNAITDNIAVLPIMVETGLVNIFNSNYIFGGMQFLDRTSTDTTEISYKDKLKKFLDNLLVTQSDVNNIRMHHKGHAFLSYRKKDRAYAKRLMTAIHDVKRDIAIWYDEFLTPGKHFDNEIEEKIIGCDFVAMAMTPNMLDKPNYVEQYEYKAATDNKKAVLPVDLLDMGEANPDDVYPGIGECIKYSDSVKIAEFIRNNESRFNGFDGNANTPEHKYYIALGYLNGIEVETDANRAVTLLKEAADMKDGKYSKEALRKLVFIYKNGAGVPRNTARATDYQADLLILCDKEYNKEKTVGNLADLLNESVIYGDYLYDENNIDTAEIHYGNTCELIEKVVCKKFSKPDRTLCALIWENATRGYTRLAVLYSKRGDTAKANKAIKKGAEIESRISKEVNKLFADKNAREIMKIRNDIINNESQAFKARNEGNYSKSINYILKNVELENSLIDMLKSSPQAAEYRSTSLAGITGWYSLAANVAVAAGRFDDAKEYCTKSINAFEELGGKLRLMGPVDIQGNVFWTYFHLSKVAEYYGDIFGKRDALKKAYDVLRELTEQSGAEKYNTYLFQVSGQLSALESLCSNAYVTDDGVVEEETKAPAPSDSGEAGYVTLTQSYEKAVELFKTGMLNESKEEFERLYERMKNKDYQESLDDIRFSMSSIQNYLYIIKCNMQ